MGTRKHRGLSLLDVENISFTRGLISATMAIVISWHGGAHSLLGGVTNFIIRALLSLR